MGWQAGDDPRPGNAPGRDTSVPGQPKLPDVAELLAGFSHGGEWEAAPPSALLAAALEAAAGPDSTYDDADTDALVGIAGRWAALESWAAAGLLATLRAMNSEAPGGRPAARTRPGLPDGWDDSLTYELSAALAMGPVSAGNLATLACTLGTRLPLTGRLLADGTLSRAKAKLIAAIFEPLDHREAARAEALIAGEVAGKTYPQVERLAWRAALAVAPDIAERRRKTAERDQARVTVFREESGAVGLSGRDLPAAQALSGHARVLERAREYAASGAFPGEREGRLEALAYLHILNGVSAADAIAFARTETIQPPGNPATPPDHTGEDNRHDGGRDDNAGPDNGRPDNDGSDHDGSDGDIPDDNDGQDDDGQDDDGQDDDGQEGDAPKGGGPGHGPDEGGPGSGNQHAAPTGQRRLPEVTIPLATLLGQAERPGENRLLGPFDPALARDLATTAARSPAAQWEITIVDALGHATGHGAARPARGNRAGASGPPPGPPQPPPTQPPRRAGPQAFPARVNITVSETLLRELAAFPQPGNQSRQAVSSRPAVPSRAAVPTDRGAHPAPNAPPGNWQLTPRTPGVPDGAWLLTMPGGRQLITRFDTVAVYECRHEYQVSAYLPGDRLRRLVAVRDHECTFPTCSRPARQCDFEHAVPYEQGGVTCTCNAGARSRRCHRVKQEPGWTVTQPQPGWHQWTTPTGRTYVQHPWQYIA